MLRLNMHKQPIWSGLRVLNTRPLGQTASLSRALTQAGAVSLELPLLRIAPTAPTWSLNLPNLTQIHHAIFTSPNAVDCFFNVVSPTLWPNSLHTVCIGPGTAATLAKYLTADPKIPSVATSEHLIDLACFKHPEKHAILLIKGLQGRTLIEDTLKQRKATVFTIPVYQRIALSYPKKHLEALFQGDCIDMIVITSQESLIHLFHIFAPETQSWLCSKLFLVLSPRLADAAKQFGVQHLWVCTLDELIQTLQSSNSKE